MQKAREREGAERERERESAEREREQACLREERLSPLLTNSKRILFLCYSDSDMITVVCYTNKFKRMVVTSFNGRIREKEEQPNKRRNRTKRSIALWENRKLKEIRFAKKSGKKMGRQHWIKRHAKNID